MNYNYNAIINIETLLEKEIMALLANKGGRELILQMNRWRRLFSNAWYPRERHISLLEKERIKKTRLHNLYLFNKSFVVNLFNLLLLFLFHGHSYLIIDLQIISWIGILFMVC